MSKMPDLQSITKDVIHYVSPEELTLITDKNHILYDSRVEMPPDESLIANVNMYGVLEPVLVNFNGGFAEVVAGRQRVKAAIEVNKMRVAQGAVPLKVAIIQKSGRGADLCGIMISENELRSDDTDVNRAIRMRKLKDEGWTNQKIDETFGISRQSVDNMLAINDMADDVQDAISAGELTATAALELKNLHRNEQVAVLGMLRESGKKPTIGHVREIVESKAYETYTPSDSPVLINRFDDVPVYRKPTKKKLEKRLALFEEQGFQRDRYLQTKPADFQEGFEYALKWVLGREQEEESFELEEEPVTEQE